MAYYLYSRNLDRMLINPREKYEAIVWCQLFDCSQKSLLNAVNKVGRKASDVKKQLQKN